MKAKFKIGRAYYIKFDDHCVGIKGKMQIEAIGWCIEDHKDHAIFTSWQVISDDKGIVDNNHEPFTVLKSCIKRKRVITIS